MKKNYTTKEVLNFAKIVAKECVRDNYYLYDISIDYISSNVITRALKAMKKIAKFTLNDYKLNVKNLDDVKIVVTMNDILMRAKKACENR